MTSPLLPRAGYKRGATTTETAFFISLPASRHCDAPAFLVAGHHGGLPERAKLKNWPREEANDGRVTEALAIAPRSGL